MARSNTSPPLTVDVPRRWHLQRGTAFAPHPDRRHLRLGRGWSDRRRRLGLGQSAERNVPAASRPRTAPRVSRQRPDRVRSAARPGRVLPTNSASGRHCARSPTGRHAAISTSRGSPAAVRGRWARPAATTPSRSSSHATVSSPPRIWAATRAARGSPPSGGCWRSRRERSRCFSQSLPRPPDPARFRRRTP